jgi:hypothetical protein
MKEPDRILRGLIVFCRSGFGISNLPKWGKVGAEARGGPLWTLMDQRERCFLRGLDEVQAALGRAGEKRPLIVIAIECVHEESTGT